MTYEKQTWIAGKDGGTPLSAVRMNHIENGIDSAHQIAESKLNENQVRLIINQALEIIATNEQLEALSDLVAKKVTAAQVLDLINEIPEINLSNYATQEYVVSAINEAVLQGQDIEIDFTPYALKTELAQKQDKVSGKGLSTNDLTNELLEKLQGIQTGAQVNLSLDNYVLKTDFNSRAITYSYEGVPFSFNHEAVVKATAVNGVWVANFANEGFISAPKIYGIFTKNTSGALADRTIAGISLSEITNTSLSGSLMGATAVGLIGAGLVEKNGDIWITLRGTR